jgi:hypothetical protein
MPQGSKNGFTIKHKIKEQLGTKVAELTIKDKILLKQQG